MSDNSSRRDAALKNLEKELKSRSRREKMRPLGVVLATLVVLVVLVGGIYIAATSGGDDPENVADGMSSEQMSDPAESAEPEGPEQCAYNESGEAAREVSAPDADNLREDGTSDVTLATNKGDIGVTVDYGQAPCAATSFEHLASESFYNDTICHRVVDNESMRLLQCGDPSGQGSGGPGYTFPDEYPVWDADGNKVEDQGMYKRGVLAMANTGQPNTNGSQFFLVDGDTQLSNDYTIFGTISESGLETLDSILEENEGANEETGGDGAPVDEVRIESADVEA